MSAKLKIRRTHHERHEDVKGRSLKDMKELHKERQKAVGSDVNKTATLVKAGTVPEAEAGTPGRTPSAEELAAINELTRTPKAPEELYVFDTLSMNNLEDRDDDFFYTETVQEFADLPQPFSPVGKSFMVDHEYKVANAMGRIFSVDTATPDVASESGLVVPDGGDLTFLTNGIYIPNTAKNAGFIEDIDFGINWAVSVGVTLGSTDCTVCNSPFSSWGYWCQEGHDKGFYYDPDSDEEDAWGYPLPCDPNDPKAVKCLRGFRDARDMYELSQVFLGAQYFAALDKTAGISKSVHAGFGWVPTEAAKKIDFPKIPDAVHEARKDGKIETLDDGTEKWVDADGIGWTFSMDEGVLCLGRENFDADEDDEIDTNDNGEEDNDGTERTQAGAEPGAADDEGDDEAAEPGEGPGSSGDPAEDGTEAGAGASPPEVIESADDDDDSEDSEDNEDDTSDSDDDDDDDESSADEVDPDDTAIADQDDEEGDEEDDELSPEDAKGVTKSTVNAFATLLPSTVRSALGRDAGVGNVVKALSDHITALEAEAVNGRAYIAQLRAEALDWYVKANLDPKKQRGVKTDSFKRMLDLAGSDADLLKGVISEQKELALARFPAKSKLQSSMPVEDPDSVRGVEQVKNYEDEDYAPDDKVDRLHR